MLRKILPEYPEDVIRRSLYYQYIQPIVLYTATPNEVELLNRINADHSQWGYSRQPFTSMDELVRVSDFLPYFEYLRLYFKPMPNSRTPSTNTLRSILPQPQQAVQRSPDFVMNNMLPAVRGQSTVSLAPAVPVQLQAYTVPELSRENNSSASRPIASAPTVVRPSRQPKYGAHPLMPPRQSSQHSSTHQQLRLPSSLAPPPPPTQQLIATSLHHIVKPTSTGKQL
jgi:hypothetical protein